MTVLSFDELNKTTGKAPRSLPYEQFFGEMGITKEQKEKRIEFAKALESEIIFLLSLIISMQQSGYIDKAYAESVITQGYTRVVEKSVDVDAYLTGYIERFSKDVVSTTLEHIYNAIETAQNASESTKNNADSYYISTDRSRLIAENEANTVYNYKEYTEAIKSGKRTHTWHTMKDYRVRNSHQEVDGIVLPIDEAFAVGDSMMMFPRDTSFGASTEEIVGCRCWNTYK